MSNGARPRVGTTKCIDSLRIDRSLTSVRWMELRPDAPRIV